MPRIRPEGGLTGTYIDPTLASASGMWSMKDIERNIRNGSWPIDRGQADPYFNLNTLLIHADGTNNANNSTIIDSSTDKIPFTGTYSVYQGLSNTLATPSNSVFGLPGVFTLEFFINFQTALSAGSILGVQASGGLVMYYDGTRITPNQFGTSNIFNSTFTSINLNQWYHIVLRRDSNNLMTMYVDGVSVGSTTTSTTYSTGVFTIGSSTFSGYISNLRITNTDVYGGTPTIPTNTLTAVSGTQFLTCQSATIVDSSSNAFTITPTGSPTASSGNYPVPLTRTSNPGQGTFSPFSQTGWSNYFDGDGDYLTVSYNSALDMPGDFTVEAWVYRAYNTQTFEIIGSRWGTVAAQNIWQLYLDSGNLKFAANNNSYTVTGSSLDFNRWYHVAAVKSSNTITLYLDGVSTGTPNTNVLFNFTSADRPLTIAKNGGTTGQDWEGYISNFRVVQRALYTSSFTPSTIPLTTVANTTLLTCADNRFVDESSSALTITPTGTAAATPFSPFAPSTTYSTSSIGGSYSFNGSTDYFRVAANLASFGFGTGDFTVEFWAYFNSIANGQQVDFRNIGAASQIKPSIFLNTSGTLSFVTSNTARISHGVAAGQWYYVTLVRSGGVSKFYLNGVANTTTYSDTNDYGTVSPLTIGTSGDSLGAASQFHNGYITNTRVTKRALYSTNFTPPTTPLTAVANTTFLLSATNAGVIDQTGKVSMATGSGTRLSTTQSKFGGSSLLFNGSSDYAIISNFASSVIPGSTLINSGDFTVEGWINLNSLAALQTAFYLNGNQTGYAALRLDITTAGALQLLVSTTGSAWAINHTTAAAVVINQWYHVAVVRSGSNFYIFVDGTQRGTTQTTSGALYAGTGFSFLGVVQTASTPTYSGYFNGYMDEIRISRYARYTANFTAPVQTFLDR